MSSRSSHRATTSSRTRRARSNEKTQIPVGTLADHIRHVVQSAFDGRRIVIFSGGETATTEAVMETNRQIAMGGGFGTIMGRDSFQREHDEAVKLLQDVMDIYKTTWPDREPAERSGAGARSAAHLISSGAASGPECSLARRSSSVSIEPMNTSTTAGSNCVPAQARNCRGRRLRHAWR